MSQPGNGGSCEAKSEKGGNIGVRFKSPKRYQKGGQKSGGGNKRVIYSWTTNPPKMACLEKVRPFISWEAGTACLQMAISSFNHTSYFSKLDSLN